LNKETAMTNLRLSFISGLCLALGATASAVDSVKTTDRTYTGTIQSISALEVVIAKDSGPAQRIPVNTIQMVRFDGEPAALNTVRVAVVAGRYEDAAETLERIDTSNIKRKEILTEIAFYRAYCAGKTALAQGTPQKILSAASDLSDFVRTNTQSYHYVEGCALVGDLLAAAGRHDEAAAYYGQLAKAPWPDVRMQAGVAMGRALLAAGKIQEAQKAFQDVLAITAEGELIQRQRRAATIGLARCMAETGQDVEKAIDALQEVIDQTDPEDHEVLAQAYNALGAAYRKTGQTKEALLAFLHTDVLYFRATQEHIEALQNLAELWNQVQRPERAAEAEKTLRDRYKRSP